MDYIRLIRWKNLLILALSTTVMYWGMLYPIMHYCMAMSNHVLLSEMHLGLHFALLLVSLICIAAGGYAVNDYFDTRIDQINRPTQVIVGKTLTREQAARFFQVLWGLGIVTGLVLSFLLRSLPIALIIVGTPGFLWFYSSSYKRQFLLGNLIVSLCVFLAIFLNGEVVISAIRLQYSAFSQSALYEDIATWLNTWVSVLFAWTTGIGLFAALLTLLREILKDLQDRKGDAEMECRTLPIVWGENGAKWSMTVLTVVILALGFYFTWFKMGFQNDSLTHTCYTFGLLLPLAAFVLLLWKSHKVREYAQLSTMLKYIMLIDSFYPLAIAYIFYLNFA